MNDTFYNLGVALFYSIPVVIVLVCLYKIRKNREEIKRLEQKQGKKKK